MQALTGEITRDNPGVTPGTQSEIKVDGVVGQSIECNNPSANSGRGERDQVVAFQRADGALRYFVFVAPTPDFGKLQPTFQKILQSVRFQ